MEIKVSLPYLLEPITDLCPEPNESYLFTTHFNIITWLNDLSSMNTVPNILMLDNAHHTEADSLWMHWVGLRVYGPQYHFAC